jgi:hypothetical protein
LELDNEKFIREQVRKMLLEFDDLGGSWVGDQYGAGPRIGVFKTLFSPFIDVLKVSFVAAKDITSAALDIADYALTFDKKKQKDIKERFRQRRQKYKDQMKTAYASTEAAFNGPDAKMFMFLAAPHLALTKGAAKLTWSATEPVRDKVEEYFGGVLGIGDSNIAAVTDDDKSPGLMADLKRAFFGEGLDEVDSIELILIEQERQKAKEKDFKPPSDEELDKMAKDYLESSGFSKDIDEAWDTIIEDKQKEINEILESQRDKVAGLTALAAAENIEDAAKVVAELKSNDVDFSEPLSKVVSAVKSDVEKLKAGGKDVEAMLEELKKSPQAKDIPPDAPVDAYIPLIEAGLLAATFGSVVEDAKNQSVSELLGFVAEMSPDDLARLSSMNDRGKEYADMIFKFRDDLLNV